MAWNYTREPPTQHLLVGSMVVGIFAIGSTAMAANLWAAWVGAVSDRVALTGGLMLLHTAVFWPVCLAFHVVDTTDRPQFIARYRIQTSKRKHPPLGKTIRLLLLNQFFFLPLLLLAFGETLFWRGWRPDPVLPTAGRLAFELVFQAVISVGVFYGTHWFLHRKWWMRHVHRVHHEFRTTTALASEYAHPVEFAIGNFLTMVGGALILAPHLVSMYLFALLGLMTILIHHCGYALPWAPWAVPHDWHHYRFKELFGTVGLLDRVFGTDEEFRTLEDGDVR